MIDAPAITFRAAIELANNQLTQNLASGLIGIFATVWHLNHVI